LDARVTLNIPNVITLGRIIAVPVVFWLLLSGKALGAFVVFCVAGASDAIDGYLAKRFRWQTDLGAYLDPLADKLLIVSIYVALAAKGDLPLWLVVAVVSRDILIIAAVMLAWLMERPVRIKPALVSKLNTASQILLAAVVLADNAFKLDLEGPRLMLVWSTGTLTIGSFIVYMKAWLDHMSADTTPGGGTTSA
jgi:cardiolipin synthase